MTEHYAEMADHPDEGYHFHTGRAATARLGYDDGRLEGLPESGIEAFAGVADPFSWDAVLGRFGSRATRTPTAIRGSGGVDIVTASLMEDGIEVHTGAPVDCVSSENARIAVTPAGRDTVRAERLLVATVERSTWQPWGSTVGGGRWA